ncbi:hypothetical protein AB4Y45_33330 [Paraburkholderia sp. EG287A]|uniref:hypothetical protein n=1 Tax=Paraburkholderia sp. EG287A TaxID=3237012 RepID=UPI0034D308EF
MSSKKCFILYSTGTGPNVDKVNEIGVILDEAEANETLAAKEKEARSRGWPIWYGLKSLPLLSANVQ